MKARMSRRVRRRIRRLVVQTGCAEAADNAVRHGLAACDGGFILEVEEDVGFSGGVEGFGVPCYTDCVSLIDMQFALISG